MRSKDPLVLYGKSLQVAPGMIIMKLWTNESSWLELDQCQWRRLPDVDQTESQCSPHQTGLAGGRDVLRDGHLGGEKTGQILLSLT